MGKVLSWSQALKMGYEPRLYDYTPGAIPVGTIEAYLDFKIWSKKVIGINCYFTRVASGQKFQLTVYGQAASGMYRLSPGGIDFSTCPHQRLYSLTLLRLPNGKVGFTGCRLI